MNELKETLKTEYIRLFDEERKCVIEWEHLPPGSIQKKHIKGHEYYYLQYRDKAKIKSVYVRPDDVDEMSAQIDKRRQLKDQLRNIRKQMKALESLIGRDELNVSVIRSIVTRTAKTYPEITAVTLFGSRAGSEYRDDSDVDLMFESSEPVSLMRQNKIRMELEDRLGFSVDLVHGPLRDGDFLQADKQIKVYEA